MKKRKATAVWEGTGKDGKGSLTTQSKVLSNTPYNHRSRFADGTDTSPEELVAAAHAGCFSMKLAFNIDAAGFTADRIETNAVVTIEDGTVTSSRLTLNAKVEGLGAARFDELVAHALENCPISKLLNAEKTVEATLG